MKKIKRAPPKSSKVENAAEPHASFSPAMSAVVFQLSPGAYEPGGGSVARSGAPDMRSLRLAVSQA